MIFSPLNSLKEYWIDFPFSEAISKVLVNFGGKPVLGYVFKENEFINSTKTENISVIKTYSSKIFSKRYLQLYSYLSAKYIYPLSSILNMVFNFQLPSKPLKTFKDKYLKIKGIEYNSKNRYMDIIDFLIQNGDQKLSTLNNLFTKRRVSNFLRKSSMVESYEQGISDLQYLSIENLILKIKNIADSKIRLFLFPTKSLKNEVYYKLSQNGNIFDWEFSTRNNKRPNFSKHNVVFSMPLSLLIPFDWDEIIFVDSESDFYKLEVPPFFDSMEIGKKFFPNSIFHFRAPSFKLYDFFSVNLNPPYKSKIIFKKWDSNIKNIFNLSVKKGRTLFLVNHLFYSSRIKCFKCGTVVRCPRCKTPLAYSKKRKIYICPNCGYTNNSIKCEKCGSTLFEYFSFGAEYFLDKASTIFADIYLFNSNAYKLDQDFFDANLVISTTSILYHDPKIYFDFIILQNVDNFVFMDYKARDRILTLIIKLQSLLKNDGELLVFYDSNLFNLSFPLNLKSFYNLEASERKLFKFPPYYNIIYVLFDTTQLKLDYLFGKLALFLREYNISDIEVFKREEFSKGILTIKAREEHLIVLKRFFDEYKDKINLYVNPRKDLI